MKLDQHQLNLISKYLADISKILFASAVLGFFIHSESINISWYVFIGGSVAMVATITFSIMIAKQKKP